MFAMNMLHSPHKNSKQQSSIWKVSSDENIHGNMQVFCSEFCIFRYFNFGRNLKYSILSIYLQSHKLQMMNECSIVDSLPRKIQLMLIFKCILFLRDTKFYME